MVAQLVKNPPAMREIWVQSLGWKDPLEKERSPGVILTPVFLSGESPWTEEPGRLLAVHGVAQSWTRLKRLSTHTSVFPGDGLREPSAVAGAWPGSHCKTE